MNSNPDVLNVKGPQIVRGSGEIALCRLKTHFKNSNPVAAVVVLNEVRKLSR
jgi:hypothetical protein